MRLYEHMHKVDSHVIVKGKFLGIVVGQLRDELEGDQYNVFFIDEKGIQEEWLHETKIKKSTSNCHWTRQQISLNTVYLLLKITLVKKSGLPQRS